MSWGECDWASVQGNQKRIAIERNMTGMCFSATS